MRLRSLVLAALVLGAPLGAQERTLLEVDVGPAGQLVLRPGDVLGDPSLDQALHSGLPVRLRIVAQLWRDRRLFDSEETRWEWRATVVHEPLERTYLVQMSEDTEGERVLATLDEAAALLRRSFPAPIVPTRPGRYYYLVQMEVETLSLSDLDELRRWLQGDLAPAVAGDERVEGALLSGARRAVVRLLRIPTMRTRLRTPTFEVGGL